MERERLKKDSEFLIPIMPYRKLRIHFMPFFIIAVILLTPAIIYLILSTSSNSEQPLAIKNIKSALVNDVSNSTINVSYLEFETDSDDLDHEIIEFTAGVEKSNYLDIIKEKTKCLDKGNDFRMVRHGAFWVLENYIKPAKPAVACHKSVTYTTHGDLTFLDNVGPLVKRWMAPVSLAIYCPGTDYKDALESVIYLRKCSDEAHLIRDHVTFHFYFDRKHTPEAIHKDWTVIEETFKCVVEAPFQFLKPKELYKTKKNLTYYVNVGRNIAREAATTHFVFASDIELYPNPGVVDQFLQMYANLSHVNTREIFVFPIFEVWGNLTVPSSKTELVEMIHKGQAIPFHATICKSCHLVPEYDNWLKAPETDRLEIFTTAKRQDKFQYWEPIYISTHREPLYEEMLNWEGKSDKMTQGFILCVMDYDFHILNNAFLVHRPGIKLLKDAERPGYQKINRDLISKEIKPQILRLYGDRKGCHF